MFNFVVNKALQVFTKTKRKQWEEQNIAPSKHFLFLSRYEFPSVASCPIPWHSLSNFPFQFEKSKPIGLAWIETFNYLLEMLTRKVLAQQILQFAFGCALRLKRSINGSNYFGTSLLLSIFELHRI